MATTKESRDKNVSNRHSLALQHKLLRSTSMLKKQVLEIVGSLRAETSICPGMLSRQALVGAGFRLSKGTRYFEMLRSLLNELRQEGEISYLQAGKVVPRRRKQMIGPFRVGANRSDQSSPQKTAVGSDAKKRRFDYDLNFSRLDFRKRPHLYRVGIGEQGVLLVEPYKSEILPHWRFKNPKIAEASASAIFAMFKTYLADRDFVGADMARKFLQMGFTRARRYANHESGRKYDAKTGKQLPQGKAALSGDKAEAARIFYGYYLRARETPAYAKARREHVEKFG